MTSGQGEGIDILAEVSRHGKRPDATTHRYDIFGSHPVAGQIALRLLKEESHILLVRRQAACEVIHSGLRRSPHQHRSPRHTGDHIGALPHGIDIRSAL